GPAGPVAPSGRMARAETAEAGAGRRRPQAGRGEPTRRGAGTPPRGCERSSPRSLPRRGRVGWSANSLVAAGGGGATRGAGAAGGQGAADRRAAAAGAAHRAGVVAGRRHRRPVAAAVGHRPLEARRDDHWGVVDPAAAGGAGAAATGVDLVAVVLVIGHPVD